MPPAIALGQSGSDVDQAEHVAAEIKRTVEVGACDGQLIETGRRGQPAPIVDLDLKCRIIFTETPYLAGPEVEFEGTAIWREILD